MGQARSGGTATLSSIVRCHDDVTNESNDRRWNIEARARNRIEPRAGHRQRSTGMAES